MINYDDATKQNIKEHNPNQAQFSDHPDTALITKSSGSGKTNILFNLISHQSQYYKIYLYTKDQYEAKYHVESRGLKHLNDSKSFIEYSFDMNDIYKNIEEYKPNKKSNIYIYIYIFLMI